MGTLSTPWLPFSITWKSAIGFLVLLIVAFYVLKHVPGVKKIAAKGGI